MLKSHKKLIRRFFISSFEVASHHGRKTLSSSFKTMSMSDTRVTSRSCGSVAQWHSACMVSERPWVRVLVGPRSFSAPVTFGGQCGGPCSGCERLSRRSRHGSEQDSGTPESR